MTENRMWTAALAGIVLASGAVAQGSGLCPGLSGASRTQCLQNARAQSQTRADESERRLGRLNTAHRVGCGMAAHGGEAAGVTGEAMTGSAVAGAAAHLTYEGGRAVGHAVAGNDGCRQP